MAIGISAQKRAVPARPSLTRVAVVKRDRRRVCMVVDFLVGARRGQDEERRQYTGTEPL